MRFVMYSVKDELTQKFMNPMFVEENEISDQMAIRQFKSNINSIKLWKDNPNDYSLFKVGIFDDEAGSESTVIEKVISGRSVLDVEVQN